MSDALFRRDYFFETCEGCNRLRFHFIIILVSFSLKSSGTCQQSLKINHKMTSMIYNLLLIAWSCYSGENQGRYMKRRLMFRTKFHMHSFSFICRENIQRLTELTTIVSIDFADLLIVYREYKMKR